MESAREQAVTKVTGIVPMLYNPFKNGNSLKKCDVPESSYVKFEVAAGLDLGSLVVEFQEN